MQDFYSMIGFTEEAHQPLPLDELPEPGPDSALFLDFDGTLVDIAPRPDEIRLPDDLGDVLNRLCERHGGAVAIVSGRNLDDLQTRLPQFRGALAGGHGAQLRLPDGRLTQAPVDTARVVALQAAAAAYALANPGVLVEHKDAGVVLHYRSFPSIEEDVRAFAHRLVDPDPDFTCQPAKMAIEIKPYGVSKGRAIEMLLRLPPFEGKRPVFAGDDRTDEAGFEAVNEAGGISIRVGDGATQASHRTNTPARFRQWLRALATEEA